MNRKGTIGSLVALAAAVTALVVKTTVVGPPKAPMGLVWDYPGGMPVSNIVFLVYHTTNLGMPAAVWPLYAVTSGPPVGVWPTQRQEFFYVRASNTATHMLSEWNR